MKFVTYFRVSTKRQEKSGLGLEAQKRDIQIYLDSYAQVPFEVIGSYTDVASGSDNEKGALDLAIAQAKAEKAILLVSKLDRLSRKVSFISKLLEDKNLQFRVAQMPNADKFQLHIYSALAEQEREFISKRTKAALAEAKARGVVLGGLRDKTAERNKRRKQLSLERAEKLRGIVEPMKAAGCTYREIAEGLNSSCLRTERGCLYSPATVMSVLKRLNETVSFHGPSA